MYDEDKICVIGFDIGDNLGWGVVHEKGLFSCGQRQYKPLRGESRKEHPGRRYEKFYDWLKKFLGETLTTMRMKRNADVYVAIEQPFRIKGPTAEILSGYVILIKMLCCALNVGVFEVPPKGLKKYATNNGVATKEEMRLALRKVVSPEKRSAVSSMSDHTVDAIWAALYAKNKLLKNE